MKTPKLTTYVALLRGINVGGNASISMMKLKECFESLGYKDVVTYINSGNVIFKHSGGKAEAMTADIEKCVFKNFHIEIRMIVKTKAEIEAICKKIPAKWANDKDQKTDVLFLWKEVDNAKVTKEILTDPKVDEILYAKGAVIWHIDRKHYKESKMQKFIGTHIYKHMTARNVNTARKLLDLMR